MKTTKLDTVINFGTLLAAVIFGLAPLSVAYDLRARGDSAPKSLKTAYFAAVDPLSDLRQAKGELSISVKSAGSDLKNLRVRQTWIQNNGKAPIVPSDYFEPLSLTTKSPWKIVTVVSTGTDRAGVVGLRWSRKSDSEFSAAPALLNPGDVSWATVYLTKSAGDTEVGSSEKTEQDQVPLEWRGRITNLARISVSPEVKWEDYFRALGPIQVRVFGWGVPFIVLSFSLLAFLYMSIFASLGWLSSFSWRTAAIVIPALVLSLTGAEATTTYVFGLEPYSDARVDNWFNAPLIVLNVLALGILLAIRSRQRRSMSHEVSSS